MYWASGFTVGLWYQLFYFILQYASHITAGTGLNDAVKLGSVTRVATLLKEGASVTARDSTGWTPLHNAANNGDLAVTVLLLQYNADIESEDDYYEKTPLHLASSNGHLDVVEELLRYGASLTAQDANGQTPLHLAAWNGKHVTAAVLMENGADVNARDKYGSTPLRLAVIKNDAYVVESILSFCPDLRLPDNRGVTVEEFAERKSLTKMITLLQEHRRKPCSRHKLQLNVAPRIDLTHNGERCPRSERNFPDEESGITQIWRLREIPAGEITTIPCPAGTSGSATWGCGFDGRWHRTPDLSKCHSLFFSGWQEVMATENITAAEIVTEVASSLRDTKKGIALAPGDLITIGERLHKLQDKHDQDLKRLKSFLEAWKLAIKYLEGVMGLVDLMLDKPSLWWGLNQGTKLLTFTNLQDSIKSATTSLAAHQMGPYQELSVKSLTTRVMNRSRHYYKSILLTFHHPVFNKTTFALPYNFYETYAGDEDEDSIKVAFMAYSNLHCTVNSLPCSPDGLTSNQDFPALSQVNTPIVGVTIGDGSTWHAPLEEKVIMQFQHVYTGDSFHLGQRTCVWWDGASSSWATDGCRLVETNDHYSTCHCDHLTNMAVVMDIEGIIDNRGALYNVMRCVVIIGCVVAVVSQALCMICFLIFKDVRMKSSSFILANICFCLMISELVLLGGLSAKLTNFTCTVVAALLHYFFLATFTWTAIETFHKFIKSKELKKASAPLKFYFVTGYSIPLLYIISTFLLTHAKGYNYDKVCWLSIQTLIWSFACPLAGVLLFNVSVFLSAMYFAWCKESSQSSDMNYHKSTSSYSSSSTKSARSKDSKQQLPFWANLSHEQEMKRQNGTTFHNYPCSTSSYSSNSGSRTATRKVHKNVDESSSKTSLSRNIGETIFVLLLFCLTWLTGFLYYLDGRHFLAIIFTCLNSMQGLCLLFLYVVTNPQIMRELRSALS